MSDRDIAREIAPCRCEPCWTDRDRHAPDCLWYNCGEEIVDALAAARREERERCIDAIRGRFTFGEWYGGAAVDAIRALIETDQPPTGGED